MSDTAQTAPRRTLGKIVDELYAIKQERAKLAKQIKDLSARIVELDAEILAKMDEEDMETSAGKTATARRSELTVPVIEDFDLFEQYMIETGSLYLLERRPSAASYRELLAQGEEVPGLRPFTQVKISLTKKSK
jgi:hypothetical protein